MTNQKDQQSGKEPIQFHPVDIKADVLPKIRPQTLSKLKQAHPELFQQQEQGKPKEKQQG